MGDASAYPPDGLRLPPNIADTPVTREAFSRYLAEITYMDSQVGDILSVLESSGKTDDTLVLFTSEQGAQFPGCKWTNWDTGSIPRSSRAGQAMSSRGVAAVRWCSMQMSYQP